jgi:hypothetical protein
MTADASQIADRRRQWAQLTPQQQIQRVQYALLDFQDHAIRRRQQARQQQAERLRIQRSRAREYAPL